MLAQVGCRTATAHKNLYAVFHTPLCNADRMVKRRFIDRIGLASLLKDGIDSLRQGL